MSAVRLGEGCAGEGAHAAHVNTVLGAADGPVGAAWATALATPTAGHAPFVVVLRPGLPVRPFTLFVNNATITDDAHARLTWGAAQAGVAAGVARAVAEGIVGASAAVDDVLIAAVWVDPAATDADAVFAANQEATLAALRMASDGRPTLDEVVAERSSPWNPFFRPPSGR